MFNFAPLHLQTNFSCGLQEETCFIYRELLALCRFVSLVSILLDSIEGGELMITWATTGFSRRFLFHGANYFTKTPIF
jgi:hypothetical protein